MYRILALVFLAVTACSQHDADLNAVRLKLTDPGSAQFDAVDKRNEITCGFVNAKNRMGGYVGYRAFIVTSGIAEIETDLGEFATRFPSVCPTPTSKKYIELLAGQAGAYEAITDGKFSPSEPK